MNRNNNTAIKVGDRERRVITLIAKLSDAELFGIECYLAGSRAGAKQAAQNPQNVPQTAAEVATA